MAASCCQFQQHHSLDETLQILNHEQGRFSLDGGLKSYIWNQIGHQDAFG
jgi:hypothetical protein